MPRDLLKELSADVDRLLAAGASAVAGDEGLSRRGRALHALADQVPALRPIAETIDRALAAEPAKSARALLDLLLMVRQARAALATAGVAGEIGPVEPSGPWESGLTSRDVSTAFAILDGRKPGRLEALQDLLGRGACADLRLLDPMIDALGDSNAELADLIAAKALPTFGPVARPVLLARRDLRGSAGTRRVRAIFELDVAAGLDEFARLAKADPGGLGSDRTLSLYELFRITAVRARGRGRPWDARWSPMFARLLDGPHSDRAKQAIGKLPEPGRESLPFLLRDLDLDGSAADACALAAIVRIDPSAGLDLCRKAIPAGGPAVRAQALRCLAEAEPAEAEGIAENLLKPGGARLPAAVRAAARECRKLPVELEAVEEAIADALKDKVLEHDASYDAAVDALAALDHPDATGRLLVELERQVGLAKAGAKPNRSATRRATLFLVALKRRKDPASAPALAVLLRHPDEEIHVPAGEALARVGGPAEMAQAVALLGLPKLWKAGLSAAWGLPASAHFETLAPLLDGLKSKKKRERDVAEELLSFFRLAFWEIMPRDDWDPRWAAVLRTYLHGPDIKTSVEDPRDDAAYGLAEILGRESIPDLLRALPVTMRAGNSGVLDALNRMQVREALGPILEHAAAKYLYHACELLKEICGLDDLPAIRAARAAIAEPNHQRTLDDVIHELEAAEPPGT